MSNTQTQFTTAQKQMALGDLFDRHGMEIEPDSAPTWSSGNLEVCTVAAAPDGLSAELTSVGVGSAYVTMTPINNGRPYPDSFLVSVDYDGALTIRFRFQAPTPK